ncbi:MAG: hypothetical protein DSY82_05580 [Flavobacteriia bacterium]|nr:MAG: hypothetical protein DSY82_05580 [Flavobacteriia bacterium]
MKNKTIIYFLFFSIGWLSYAQDRGQFSIGFESNSQYYLDDEKTGDFTLPERFRSNNYLQLDYYIKKFSFGLQVESYVPMALLNYPPAYEKTGLATYYASYKTERLEATAGYFYEQFGSGLILRSWEDRQLGINNAIRGGLVKYNPTDYIHLTGLYGKQREGFDVSDGEIYGFNTDLDIAELVNQDEILFSLGLSYVGRKQESTVETPVFSDLTNVFSGRLDFSKGDFYINTEYVNKGKDAVIIQNNIVNAKEGNAFLLNFGYAKKGIGIDATFRRLENMTFYSDREAAGNIYLQNIINYVPALTKQHDYLLTNIYVYQAQPQVSFQDPTLLKAGETGGQIDVYYKIKKNTFLGGKYGLKLALNASYWAGLKGDYDYESFDYDTDFLGFGEKYFSDYNIEIRKKWSKKWNSIFFYANQFYNKRYIEETTGTIKSNILVAEASCKIGRGRSFRIEAQHLTTKDDKKNWAGGTFEYNFNPKFSVYVNDIYNYGNDILSDRIHYYNIGGSYVRGANRFALNYGRQRGGLLCVGGVCRYVPESTGITANIILNF